MYIIGFDKQKNCDIGRGMVNDLIIGNVFTSREHASFYFQEGKYYLRDYNSKYGTYVLVQGDIALSISLQGICFLYAKNVFSF